MKPVSLVTRPANESNKENWHIVPCRHNYCGPALVKEYFEDLIEPFQADGDLIPNPQPKKPEDSEQLVSYLYGNLLIGNPSKSEYNGYLVKVTDGKTSRIYERISTNDQKTIWSKDVPIVKDENFLLGLETYCGMADIMMTA